MKNCKYNLTLVLSLLSLTWLINPVNGFTIMPNTLGSSKLNQGADNITLANTTLIAQKRNGTSSSPNPNTSTIDTKNTFTNHQNNSSSSSYMTPHHHTIAGDSKDFLVHTVLGAKDGIETGVINTIRAEFYPVKSRIEQFKNVQKVVHNGVIDSTMAGVSQKAKDCQRSYADLGHCIGSFAGNFATVVRTDSAMTSKLTSIDQEASMDLPITLTPSSKRSFDLSGENFSKYLHNGEHAYDTVNRVSADFKMVQANGKEDHPKE